MLKKVLIILGVLLLILVGYIAYILLTTRNHSPADVAKYSTEELDISVAYCKPYKKDRVIFGTMEEGALQPYGVYWRLGANEATQIVFSTDVLFAGEAIKAGEYRMYAIPGENTWTIALNSELGKWGAFEPTYDLDVVRVNVDSEPKDSSQEQFSISFEDSLHPMDSTSIVLMHFDWDKTRVSIPIEKL